ncbi:MAG: LysR substrate-binding domain-containing protein [Pseudomonadota bacterium]
MSLTPEGSEYLERCRQILGDVDEAERSVSQHESELKGRIRITAPVEFGQRHVAPILTRFIKENPKTSVDLMLLDRNLDLVEEGVDLGLRIGRLPDSGLVALPVGELTRVVCASPDLIETKGEPKTPDDLRKLPCIRQQILARSSTWSFRDGFSRVSVKVEGWFTCNQISAAVTACVHGAGFGQFLSYQVRDELSRGELKRVLVPFEIQAIPVNIVYSGGRFASVRQLALARFLQSHLRESVFS